MKASHYNYPAVFGVCYIDLPLYIAEDLDALERRQAQLNAAKR